MVRVGIVGFGFMGRMHYRCWRQTPGVEVVAVCESNPRSLSDPASTQGNIAGADQAADLSHLEVYDALEAMLRGQRLDAISITVPTHLHAACTVAALEAGVHVLCEKPIALNLADAQRMVQTAGRCGRVLQIGHCVRFWPEYAKAKELIEGGGYGGVRAATFQRLAATAARQIRGWFVQEELSGGMPLDLHIHDTDFVQHLFGVPRAVSSAGTTDARGGITHMVTRYDFGDGRLITAEGGWAMMPSYGFQMRFHVVLERATLDFDSRQKPTLRVCPLEGEAFAADCDPTDAYARQIDHFVRSVRGERFAPTITPQQACESLRIVLAERESMRLGQEVTLR